MKWYCTVCGYVHEGDQPPEQCPVCKQPASKFKLMEEEAEYATVHKLGEGKAEGVSEDIIKDLKANFEGECAEVGRESLTERAIPKSRKRSRDTRLKKLTTLPVLRSFSAKC